MPTTYDAANSFGSARKLVLSSGAAMLALALTAPAFAQDTPADPGQPTTLPGGQNAAPGNSQASGAPSGAEAANSSEQIVVTGSRISRRDYSANSPIITANQALIEQSSTAAIEQNLNKLPQFTPAKTPTGQSAGDIQPTATNTPGSASVSLRGLGANRNLVLLDGRRATPGNATGVVDINTIPSAAIERVEIITGGASATYGADAIGGVANFILKKNFKGIELDGQVGISQAGDGFEYQVSGIMGTDFDDGRGNVSIAMSTNKRQAMYQRNRSWYRDLWADPLRNGTAFFPPAAGVAAAGIDQATLAAVFPRANPLPTAAQRGFTIYANPDGTPFFGVGNGGASYPYRGGVVYAQNVDNYTIKQNAAGNIAANDTFLYSQLPLERYNFFARGNYEVSDNLTIFGQGLFSHVHTRTVQEGGPITGGWSASVPFGSGIYAASLNANGTTNRDFLSVAQGGTGRYGLTACPTVGGCTNSTVFPLPAAFQTLLNSRSRAAVAGEPGFNANPALNGTTSLANTPVSINYLFPFPRATETDVDTWNLTAGVQGSIPDTDWTYEVFANYGESSTFAVQTGVISLNRLRAVLNSPNFGRGFSANSNVQGGGFGSNTATCTSGLNFFTDPTLARVSADCLNAIRADLKNRSKIRQNIWEADTQGSLFSLPAGDLKVALGASYRATTFTFTNDTLTSQGVSFQDQALGIYPSGDTTGRITAREIYGELLVPVLKDTFIKSLDLELGGRISKYSTTGTSYTYKILGDLQATNWLRFRGGYNRAERAPNIAELFLAPQQTFASNGLGDVCSQRSTFRVSANATASPIAADVQAVCRAVIDRSAGAGQGAVYYNVPVAQQPAPGGGTAFPTLVGNANLTPEKADTWTAGVVISSPFQSEALRRLRLSVDWFSIKIKNAIGFSPGATIQTCLDPTYNPLVTGAAGSAAQATAAAASAQCLGLNYQPGATSASPPGLGNILMSFTNAGTIDISGIDGQLDWGIPIGPGTLNLNVAASYYLHYKVAELAANPLVDYTGSFGTTSVGLNGVAYEWRTLTTVGYTFGGASVALQWQHLPAIEDAGEPLAANPIAGAPKYDLFNLNTSYSMGNGITFRFGVDNLFNKRPPFTNVNTAANLSLGQLPGGSYNATYYDDLGRRFYLGVKAKF